MSSYAILGCGSVGHAVADDLVDQGKDVLILDKADSRVEALRDQDLNATTADISERSVVDHVDGRDVVLILSSDVEANKAAVEHIRSADGDQFLVVRASDPVSGDELTELGADIVINPSTVIADATLRAVESGELEYKAAQLAEVIESTEDQMAIVTHDNPDPDSIASAIALQAIAEHSEVEADICYFGEIGHQENRAFVNLLGVDLLAITEVEDLDPYDTIALLEGEPTPDGLAPIIDIFIDHLEPSAEYETEFQDIRTNVSSASTILTKYVQEYDLKPSGTVATALLYGIRAETLDFKRETRPADLTAAAYLYPFASHDTLEQVESPSMSPETLDVLAEAIQSREVEGSHLISNAGFVRDRDALVQAAQHLLDLEGITTTAVFGINEDTIYLAARSKDIRLNIGRTLEEAFDEVGEAVGHSNQANVEIPLGLFTGLDANDENRETLLELAGEAVKRKLFDVIGVEGSGGNGA
jgi:nanoRNase/pAp phosphatase (c-di-AMP/oligoRNAs hydrolase)